MRPCYYMLLYVPHFKNRSLYTGIISYIHLCIGNKFPFPVSYMYKVWHLLLWNEDNAFPWGTLVCLGRDIQTSVTVTTTN